jgi:POT family proton-dependent oligopeptide transporter
MSNSNSPQSAPASEARSSFKDHPIGFWFFFWGEFAERCCYYGMRGILLLYMIQILGFEDGKASMVTSYFMAACYLLPLVGGYVADNFLGKYRTIVYFSVPYIAGQVILGISALHNETCLYISLGLLAMGSGVIKPNISTLMGLTYDQKCPGKSKLRSDAFAMFYGAINIGAFISGLCVPAIRNYFGGSSRAYAIAFLFPAALMILAFIVFALGKPFYAVEKIERKTVTPEERSARWVLLRRLFGLFLVVTIFWSIFDQSVTTWTLFARDYLHLNLFGLPLSPDQLQAVNPLMIVLLLPPVTLFWHFLSNRGMNLRPTSKMLIGFTLTLITMSIVAVSGFLGSKAVVKGGPEAIAAAEKVAKYTQDNQPGKFSLAANALAADGLSRKAVEWSKEKETTPERWKAMKNAFRECQKMFESLPTMPDLDPATIWTKETADAFQKSVDTLGENEPNSEILKATAEATEKNAKTVLEKHDAACLALSASSHTANAAVKGANAALLAGRTEGDKNPVLESARLDAETWAILTKASSDAVKASVKTATMPRDANSTRPEINAKIDVSACSDAANRANSSASAARKSVESLKYGDRQVVLQHAAIATLAAADTAILAARTTSRLDTKQKTPEVITIAEDAAAAGRISLWWQLIPYLLITISEICISVVGLELAFAVAPPTMKSFVTACWLLTVFLAGIINAQLTPFYDQYVSWLGITLTPGIFFGIFALLMVPVTLAFIVVSKRFNSAVARTN